MVSPKYDTTALLEGFHLVRANRFYEAHEAWEDIWVQSVNPQRAWLQSLICLAGAGVHRDNLRYHPMRKLIALSRLRAAQAGTYSALGISSLEILQALKKLEAGGCGSTLFSVQVR